MEIQIKGMRYHVDDVNAFFETINVGDVVTLVVEPENICDSGAVAVYYRYKRIGYVKSSDLEFVHEKMMERTKMKVTISRKFIDRNDEKGNELEFQIDLPADTSLICWRDCKEMNFEHLLGNEKSSTLVETEVCLQLIIDDFNEAMEIAMTHDQQSAMSKAAVEHALELASIYAEHCQNSLSGQCTMSLSPICRRLRLLEDRYAEFAERLHEAYSMISKIDSHFSRLDFVTDVYDRMMEQFIKECSKRNGFFERYVDSNFKMLNAEEMAESIEKKIKELHDWILALPDSLGSFYFNNKRQFCIKLRYKKYDYKDLYEIYTNIALLGFLLDMKMKYPKHEKPDFARSELVVQSLTLVQQHVHFKNFGDVNIENFNGNLNSEKTTFMGDDVHDGGLKIVKK